MFNTTLFNLFSATVHYSGGTDIYSVHLLTIAYILAMSVESWHRVNNKSVLLDVL